MGSRLESWKHYGWNEQRLERRIYDSVRNRLATNVTTKEMIKSIHDAGFNTIRIPITWGTMIDDEDGYSINPD